MTWFDILKDVKDEAEEFFNDFVESLLTYFDAMDKRLIEDLDTLDETSPLVEGLNELERKILAPILDMVDIERKKALDNVHDALDIIRISRKEVADLKETTKDTPIEIKIRNISERFADLGVNPKGYPNVKALDQDKLDDILHRLGFEGKGME
tara:strand:+ start:8140 stop:8598 length:459 start_codon:yes stop_codon:yes gene_type:complete